MAGVEVARWREAVRQEGQRAGSQTGPGVPRQPEGDARAVLILQSHPGAGASRGVPGGKGTAWRSPVQGPSLRAEESRVSLRP